MNVKFSPHISTLNSSTQLGVDVSERLLRAAAGAVVSAIMKPGQQDRLESRYDAKVDSGGMHLRSIEKNVEADYGNLLYTAITKEGSGDLSPAMREVAFGINNQFPVVTDSTEKIHAWAERKYGSFYRYMQFRRGGAAMHSRAKQLQSSVNRKRTARTREQAKEAMRKELREMVDKKYRYVGRKYEREGPHEGNRSRFAADDMQRRQISKLQRNVRQRAGQGVGFGRTGYFKSGRMAAGMRDNTVVRIEVNMVDGMPVMTIHGGLKGGRWRDPEAANAFKYMSKRQDFRGPMESLQSDTVFALVEARLEQRESARNRESAQRVAQAREVNRAVRDENRRNRDAQVLEERQKRKEESEAKKIAAAQRRNEKRRQQRAEARAAKAAKAAKLNRLPVTRTREERLGLPAYVPDHKKPRARIKSLEETPATTAQVEDAAPARRPKARVKAIADQQKKHSTKLPDPRSHSDHPEHYVWLQIQDANRQKANLKGKGQAQIGTWEQQPVAAPRARKHRK